MPNPCSPDAAPIDPDQEATPMNATPDPSPPLWQLEEADREVAERARVAEWVAGHASPAHDAAIAARALREAADDMDDTDDPDAIYVNNGDIDVWLRARADRIEREGAES